MSSFDTRAYQGPVEAVARLWAKSDPVHPLWCHLLDVAAVAFELIPYFGTVPGLTPEWTAALVGLHDIGKADPLFQSKSPELAARLPRELFADVVLSDSVGFRHEARSADILRIGELLPKDSTAGRRLSQLQSTVARATAGHHGRIDPPVPTERLERIARWKPLRRALYDLVVTACGACGAPFTRFQHADRTGVHLLGLTIAADWIASNTDIFAPPRGDLSDPRGYFAAARTVAQRAIARIGFPSSRATIRPSPEWDESWPDKPPRGIQPIVSSRAREIGPGLVIIEAPMGEGKTEAAIHLADAWAARLGIAGFYMALPTQATSNQMHGRVESFLARRHPDAIRALLVHGMAWLMDDVAQRQPQWSDLDAGDDTAEQHDHRAEADAWLRNSRRALLAPFAVGTVDQVLLTALGVRFGALRLLGLSTKVLIVDEVHACDTFMRRRLERALAWCRALGTPVILLSATLPRSQRESLVQAYLGGEQDEEMSTAEDSALPEDDPYPLITVVPANGEPITRHGYSEQVSKTGATRTIRLIRLTGLLDREAGFASLAERLLTSIARGGCAVVIVNTVSAAQKVYSAVREQAPADVFTLLFHSRFPAWRRQELEREVVDRFGDVPSAERPRPPRAVIVATQVVEQSLDIDFDVMFSELAPVDLLFQRAGRLQRHSRPERAANAPDWTEPTLHLLLPAAGSFDFGKGSEWVYFRLHLLRTLGVVWDRETLQLPNDFRPLIEQVYGAPDTPLNGIPLEELQTAINAEQEETRTEEQDAKQHLVGLPNAEKFFYPEVSETFTVPEAAEGEVGNHASRLRARTRRDDSLVSVFALVRPGDVTLADAIRKHAADKRLPRQRMKELMLARVGVPVWWLGGEIAATSAKTILGCPVFELFQGGAGASNIRYDDALGLVYEAPAKA